MIKGMFGGALMVALMVGGAFVWSKLSGHEKGMGYEHFLEQRAGAEISDTGGSEQADGHDQHGDSPGHDHGTPDRRSFLRQDPPRQGTPAETGQSAFAAISEIVTLLMADPATDWQKVNIAALREHLVDMDMLITHAQVETTEIENGIEMTVNLSGPGGGAASRMVPAHAPVLAAETGWQSTVVISDNTAVWRVVSAENVDRIRALGFFGLMAVGDHHRKHHFGMASGAMVH